jgi:hypothetical protein
MEGAVSIQVLKSIAHSDAENVEILSKKVVKDAQTASRGDGYKTQVRGVGHDPGVQTQREGNTLFRGHKFRYGPSREKGAQRPAAAAREECRVMSRRQTKAQ